MNFKKTIIVLSTYLFCHPALSQSLPPQIEGPYYAQKGKRQRAGILRLYRNASSLYDKRKYTEAIDVYNKILRLYPSHQPSLIYRAKSLYRLGKYKQSYKAFRQLVLGSLDPETKFEYGQVHFRQKKYSEAFEAFQQVPSGHQLFDLASYYGGVSALKSRQYSESVNSFAQAVVLPSKLMKSKKLLQKQAEQLMLEEQRRINQQQKQKHSCKSRGRNKGKSREIVFQRKMLNSLKT